MKLLSLIYLGMAAVTVQAMCRGSGPDPKELDRVVEQVHHVQASQPGIRLSGYVDAGYVYNFIGGNSTIATTGYAPDAQPRGDFNLNAVKLTLERPLGEGEGWQAGFRVDVMVGEDAAGFGGVGAEGTSDVVYVQQGYVAVRVPVGNGLEVQVGRIGSILGFEADERAANLNITGGLNAALDPGPAAGVLMTYPATERLTLMLGVNNGNGLSTSRGVNADLPPEVFEARDGYAFNAGAGMSNAAGNVQTQLAVSYSPWGDEGFGQLENEPLWGVNWWGTWAPKCCEDKLLLAFNASYWGANDFARGAALGAAADDASNFMTVALYAKYQFTPVFSLAGRAEYTHTDDDQFLGVEPGTAPVAGGSDFWGLTLTAGFNLLENVLVRTEYRFDWGNDTVATGNTVFDDSAHTVAAQVVYSF